MSEKRIDALRTGMVERSIDAAVLIYSRDILYYAGVSVPSILLVTPGTARLYARRAFGFAREDSTIDDVVAGGSLRTVAERLESEKLHRSRIGLELDVVPAELFFKIREALPDAEFVSISPLIISQRMVKDSDELELVRVSASMADKGQRRALNVIREGISEIEMAAEVEAELRRNKHEGILVNRRFDTYTMYGMIGSGDGLTRFAGFANVATGVGLSRAMRISASDRIMKRGDLVMIDITGSFHGYITDVTRPYVIGPASKKQIKSRLRYSRRCAAWRMKYCGASSPARLWPMYIEKAWKPPRRRSTASISWAMRKKGGLWVTASGWSLTSLQSSGPTTRRSSARI